jgi:hypothetical protein
MWLLRNNFFLWGYVMNTVCGPPVPHDFHELMQRIITSVTAIEEDLLEKVWQELVIELMCAL